MRVKLLKKIRKIAWVYFRKDKFPVLINHEHEYTTTYDLELCKKITGITDLEEIKVPLDEWALRLLKKKLLTRYGYSIDKHFYRAYSKYYNRKKPKNQ